MLLHSHDHYLRCSHLLPVFCRLERRFITIRQLTHGHLLVLSRQEFKSGSLFTLPGCPEEKLVWSLIISLLCDGDLVV